MKYTSRGLRRRGEADQWEATLSHRDPLSGEVVRSYHTITKEFAALCKMNGFRCTFHDLRHTFATFMIAEGVDVRTVSSYLGHANVALTLNTYADVDPQTKLAADDKIEAA